MPQPIIDQARRWTLWYENEVFTGTGGTGRYVPNVDDAVWSWNGIFRIVSVDYSTGLSAKVPHNFTSLGGGFPIESVLLGSTPNNTIDTHRVYINTSVVPHDLAVDHLLHIYGTAGSYCKIFKGTDISAQGQVISGVVNSSGQVTSENIPLESIRGASGNEPAIKIVKQGISVETLDTGEIVTAVIYSTTGAVLSSSILIVERTDFVRTLDHTQRYVVGIELLSPYLSSNDAQLLEYPANMLLQSSALLGRVRYSTGAFVDYPIDGNKFSLFGMDSYIANIPNQTADLLLNYSLGTNEYGYGANSEARTFTKPYRVKTTEILGTYTVKLFVVPVWNSAGARWVLNYFLYSLERQTFYEVTNYIQLSPGYAAFDGALYVGDQQLRVAINLADIPNAGYAQYHHVQDFHIELHGAGADGALSRYWTLIYSDGGNGLGALSALVAVDTQNSGSVTVSLDGGQTTVAGWLDTHYVPTEPITFPRAETAAPAPTHVRLMIGPTWQRLVPIEDILITQSAINVNPAQGSAARLHFVRVDQDTVLELGVLGATVKRI